jgi:retron-type reverse transcriptase
MNPTKMAQKQMALAQNAQRYPTHRFTNLYRLLHWDEWMRRAADAVLARPGSSTAGVDGTTRDHFKATYEEQLHTLIDSLKRNTYAPQPVRRVLSQSCFFESFGVCKGSVAKLLFREFWCL